MEKRHFSRVSYHVRAEVRGEGDPFVADVENLSLRGVLVTTDRILAVGCPVEIVITLAGGDDPVELHLNGEVVRSEQGDLAISFVRVDPTSFVHLRNIVSICTGDADTVLDELVEFVEAAAHSRDPS